MTQTSPQPQPTDEILKERLKRRIAFSWRTFLPLSVLFWITPAGIEMILANRGHHFIESGKAEILALLCAGLLAQAFALLWTAMMRFLKPETTPRAGWWCFWLNILVVLAWPVVAIRMFPILPMPAGLFPASFLLFMWIYFILEATLVNRLILALRRPNSEKAEQMASPCPTYFQQWNFLKSLVFLPLITIAVFEMGAVIVLVATDHFTLQALWRTLIIGAFFGAATLPVSLFTLPYCFLTQTRTPYAFQRIIRAWCTDIKHCPAEEKPAFLWWLSHPEEPWPEDFTKISPYLDVAAFNWHNPDAWAGPLDRAAQMYQKNLLKSTAPLPALIIGEQAPETAKEIADEPVTKITPLFQAVIQNDLPILQQLLPQHPLELNRPFLATGNTLLHVAALNGHEEIVRLLLEQSDIDKTRKNNDGKTAADLAREKGFTQIAELLQ